MLNTKKSILEKLYPILGLIFGFIFIFLIPTYVTPDENVHYGAAYHLSNQLLGIDYYETYYGKYMRRIDAEYEMKLDDLSDYNYFFSTFSQKNLTEEDLEIIAAPNTFNWDYYGHFLPGVGITIARLLKLNFGWGAFFGTFLHLLFFVAMMTYALRKLPFGKRVFFVISLLPITVQQASSMSYDVPIFACCGVVMALSLKWGIEKTNPSLQERCYKTRIIEVLAYLLCIILLWHIKGAAYFPIVFMPLITLWDKKWLPNKKRILAIVLVLLALLFVYLVPLGGYAKVFAFLFTQKFSYDHNAYLRAPIMYVLHPLITLQMIVNTFVMDGKGFLFQMLGGLLGPLDIVVFKPAVWFTLFVAIFSVLRAKDEEDWICGKKRIWMVLLAIVPDVAAIMAMLVLWTPETLNYVMGVQGRYLLPTIFVVLLSIGHWKRPVINLKEKSMDMTVAISMIIIDIAAIISVLYWVAN